MIIENPQEMRKILMGPHDFVNGTYVPRKPLAPEFPESPAVIPPLASDEDDLKFNKDFDVAAFKKLRKASK